MESRKNTVLLDVDPSIMETNLLITDPDAGLGSLFPKDVGPASKVVTPIPGLCIKLRRTTEDHGKVFINICHTREIPEPADISEERLVELWNNSTETCEYRVPLSIGERRQEPDKSGLPADVFDVAVNTTFFGKVESSNIFRMFIIDVVMQGVEEKFNVELDKEDYVILKNRRAMGNILPHRVRAGDKRDDTKPATPLIQELGSQYSPAVTAAPAAPAAPATPASDAVKPDFRLVRQPASGPARALVAQYQLPEVVSAGEVTLDVGEDRVILSGGRRGTNYHLDVFLPFRVTQELTTAVFDGDLKILTVTMPVVQTA